MAPPSPAVTRSPRKRRRPGLVYGAVLVAAVLAWACFLLLTAEGANVPGRSMFAIAGLLALFGSAPRKLKPFLSVSALVVLGVLSVVPGFPGSSATEADVDWIAAGLGASGPFAFIVIRWLRRRS